MHDILQGDLESSRLRGIVLLHAFRLKNQYLFVMWAEAGVAEQWAHDNLRVVVGTCDKLRECLSRNPWWVRNRSLDLLVHDEAECEQFPDVLALLAHFRAGLFAGDELQRLHEHRLAPRGMPNADPAAEKRPEQNLSEEGCSIVNAQSSIIGWLRKNACNHYLLTTTRCGPDVISLGRVLDDQRYGHITAAGSTQVDLIQFKHSGEGSNSGWDEHHVGNKVLFVLIIVLALEQVRLGKTVAIVVLYRKSLQFLVAVLGKLREHDDRVRDIVAESPESIQGSTVQCCHFLCLQSRCRDERMPGGHSLDRERRWTGLTRASEQLNVYVQEMSPSCEISTRRLQDHVAKVGTHLDLKTEVSQCVRSLRPETAGTLCQSLDLIDSIYDKCHGQALRQLDLARSHAPSCAEWMLLS